jgi:threonine/homoserine/homoserine lactone efflux protein
MEDIEKQLKEQEEKITKDYLNARYGLWSALINVNGILIGASAIAFFVNPNASKLWAVILLFSSGISILLILINFFVVERLFM